MTQKDVDHLDAITELLQSEEFKTFSNFPEDAKPPEAIPILNDVVAGQADAPPTLLPKTEEEASAEAFFFGEDAPAPPPQQQPTQPTQAPPVLKAAAEPDTQADNPFLPDSIMDKLQTNKEASRKIIEELNNFAPPRKAKSVINSNSPAFRQLEEKLVVEAEMVLQDIVDEFVPMIEAELHKRLKTEMNHVLNDVIEQRVREALGEAEETV